MASALALQVPGCHMPPGESLVTRGRLADTTPKEEELRKSHVRETTLIYELERSLSKDDP